MNGSNFYTITIIRNIGIPISFTVKKWKLLFFILALFALIGFLCFEAFNYLKLREEGAILKTKLDNSEKKVVLLTSQIAHIDNEQFNHQENYNQPALSGNQSLISGTVLTQPNIATEAIWVADQEKSGKNDQNETSSLEVTKLDTRLKNDDLFLKVELTNTSAEAKPLGGYLCITLVNNDVSPTKYTLATGGTLGEKGFPSTYKSGRQYLLKKNRRTRSYRIKYELTEPNEYYTDAILLSYSYKGRLLNKQIIPIDRNIFLEQ